MPLRRVPGTAAVARAIDAERRADEQRAGGVERLREEARRAAGRRHGAVLVGLARTAASNRATAPRAGQEPHLRSPAARQPLGQQHVAADREQTGRPGRLRRHAAVAVLLPVLARARHRDVGRRDAGLDRILTEP